MIDEATTNARLREDTVLKGLPSHFPNPRAEFFDTYKREADEYDRDLTKKYDDELNTTLIFAGLFSAVATAFLLDVQKQLEPDFQQMDHDLLKIVASVLLGNVPTGADAAFPKWDGPDPTVVHVQAILYSSLATSLLSAFIAMLGKQWLNRYTWVDMRGSVIDRSRNRQRKMNGMVTWRFHLVMECLSIMRQAALLLFSYALSHHLFFINKAVATVVMGFAAFGLLLYALIVLAATLSYDCPFQTPLSRILRFLIYPDSGPDNYPRRLRTWFWRNFPQMGGQQGPKPGDTGGDDGSVFPGHFEVSIATDPLFNRRHDWGGHVLDSICIVWLFEMSMDTDVIMRILRFIPEVVWHADIRTTPLERLYDTLFECFDHSSGHPVVIPKLRNKAYLGAKALLHLTIQRKCIGNENGDAFVPISNKHKRMYSKHYDGDSDLTSTLGIIDCVFNKSEPMCWKGLSFTPTHHAWMGHVLLYRAWDVLGQDKPLPDDVREFILHSFQLEPPPPATVVADCLIVIGLVLGISLQEDHLSVVDKSSLIEDRTDGIFTKLARIFENPTPENTTPDNTTPDIGRALEAICLLSNHVSPSESYDLFRKVIQAPVPEAHSQKKWEASRLALHSAYKGDRPLPRVEDPQYILAFLNHHFELAIKGGQTQDEPIHDALHALACAPDVDTNRMPKSFNPTTPLFVRGICYSFQDNRPAKLHKAALLFLPLIGDGWFNAYSSIASPTAMQMNSFCKDWASIMDSINHTNDVKVAALTVLLGMFNSSHWRPHITLESWKLLGYFALIPDDSQPLRRCLDNPELMDAIKNVDNPVGITLWLEILWSKYVGLLPTVREQLVTVTKEIARNEAGLDASRSHIERYMSNISSESRKAKEELKRHVIPPTDPVAAALVKKVENLQQAVSALGAIRRENPPAGVQG